MTISGTVNVTPGGSFAASSGPLLIEAATVNLQSGGALTANAQNASSTTASIDVESSAVTLAGGSSIRGDAVTLNAAVGTVGIDTTLSGGAQITSTALQIQAATLNLTNQSGAIIVGARSEENGSTPAGFVANETIQNYASTLSSGTLQVTGASSITVDSTGVLDGRQVVNGAASGNSLNMSLVAPTITVANGAQILTQAINTATTSSTTGTAYGSGSINLNAFGGSGLSMAGTLRGGNISLATDGPLALAATAVIDGREALQSGTSTAQPYNVTLSAASIGVTSGARIYGNLVDFDFTEAR